MKVNSIWSIDLLVPLGAGEVEEDSAHTIESNLQNDTYDVNMWKAKVYKPVSRLCRKRYKS